MFSLNIQHIEQVIQQMNKRYNMNVVIVKKGQLEFALKKPDMVIYGHEQYPELYQKAAVLMESITKTHPLSDGNKRTAMMAAEFMIKANGGELVLPLKSIRLSVDTAMDTNDDLSDIIQKWFKVHTAMNPNQLCAMTQEKIEEESIIRYLINNDKKNNDLEKIISRWLVFDKYSENKRKWDELSAQWQCDDHIINDKSKSFTSTTSRTNQWDFALDLIKHTRNSVFNLMDTRVEKIDDLIYYDNSDTELTKIESHLKKLESIFTNPDKPAIIYQKGLLFQYGTAYQNAMSEFEKLVDDNEYKDKALFCIGLLSSRLLNQ